MHLTPHRAFVLATLVLAQLAGLRAGAPMTGPPAVHAGDAPVIAVAPPSISASLHEGGSVTRTLRIANLGPAPLHYTLTIDPAVADGSGPGVAQPRAPRAASTSGADATRGAGAPQFELRASSPAALDWMAEDPANPVIYAGSFQRFFRYYPAFDRWSELSPAPRTTFDGTILNGKLYARVTPTEPQLAVYDIASGVWSTLALPRAQLGPIASDGTRYLYMLRTNTLDRYDPATNTWVALPGIPWEALRQNLTYSRGMLYVHDLEDLPRFGRYDIAAGVWQALPPVPGIAVSGAAVDEVTNEYVCYGPRGAGRNLYRYSITRRTWTVTNIPVFAVDYGALAWMLTPVPAVYFAAGMTPEFARVLDQVDFATASVAEGTVPGFGSQDIDVVLDSGDLPEETYHARVTFRSDDPATPSIAVPVTMQVVAIPNLVLARETLTVESVADFDTAGARTEHVFRVAPWRGTGATLGLAVDGSFGTASQYARLIVEGRSIGQVGRTGHDCATGSGTFAVSPDLLQEWLADGEIRVRVENTAAVGASCAGRRHIVTLSYHGLTDLLEFGAVPIAETRTLPVLIENHGSVPLIVSGVASNSPEFGTETPGFVVAPHGTRAIEMFFRPSQRGPRAATLRIASNDPDEPVTKIAVVGLGVAAPAANLSATSVRETLFPREAAARTIEVHNTGDGDLHWRLALRGDVDPEEAPSLEQVLARLDADIGRVTSLLPSRFEFTEGENGFFHDDGGGDMYDVGNIITTPLGGPLYYANGAITHQSAFGLEGRYFTRKYPGLFVLAADTEGAAELVIQGNLGADGMGNVDGAMLATDATGARYRGFVKRVYGSANPSVNHLVIVLEQPGQSQEFAPSSDDDFHRVTGLGASRRIYLLVFGREHGGYVDNGVALAIMNAFVATIEPPPAWLTATPSRGVTPPGGRTQVTLVLDAADLTTGDRAAGAVLVSDDPTAGRIPIAVQLLVTAGRALRIAPDPIDFGTVSTDSVSVRQVVMRNPGTEPLVIRSIDSSLPDFAALASSPTIPPRDSATLTIRFTPRSSGARRAQVVIGSDDPRGPAILTLSGNAITIPDFTLRQNTPNPFRAGTAIGFDLPRAANVSLRVFDMAGRMVRVLAEGAWPFGRHEVKWDGGDSRGHKLPPGIYLSRFETGGYRATKRLVMLE